MDELKLTVENDDTNHPTETLPGLVVGTRKMTSETVIGSMGGDLMGDSSENNHHPRNHNHHPYDGGSLSTHDENDDDVNRSAARRRITAVSSSAQRCFGKLTRSLTQRLPYRSHIDTTDATTHNNLHGLMNEVSTNPNSNHPKLTSNSLRFLLHNCVPSTAFRALMRRNMLYRKRNWISTVRVGAL